MTLTPVTDCMPEGATQSWDPERYRRNAGFVAKLGFPLIELLNPKKQERILDLGCGDGTLTMKLIHTGADVVGVDASPDQIDAARALGLNVREMNGEKLQFCNEFDAVFSNAAMHWMTDADAVIEGVWRSLRPGGRFVSEMGGAGNIKTIRSGLHQYLDSYGYAKMFADPWYFPSVKEQRDRLLKNGFTVREISLFSRPTPLPGDIAEWLETFADSYIKILPSNLRGKFVDDLTNHLRPLLRNQKGIWIADYVRLRFYAVRQG